MSSIAMAVVQGNLTADPEMRVSAKGTAVTGIRVAVNHVLAGDEPGTKQETVSFFAVVVFGKQGETVSRYLKKGDGVTVVGRLSQSRWQDQSGNNRERVEIIARDVVFGQKAKGSMQVQASPEDDAALNAVREAVGDWPGVSEQR